ncbi:hypothetical protein DFH08DRAFT_823963 [Mycena albidolilacea]|uniref:Uncharacterized protein n=1 Tax=Mycena albidolilacea TaxID=1033008 RepID=A0AAD6Z513_9AGAR|nr:hypothetical protein DFH08DRAFT_823963 [Mycena albidolilacea]
MSDPPKQRIANLFHNIMEIAYELTQQLSPAPSPPPSRSTTPEPSNREESSPGATATTADRFSLGFPSHPEGVTNRNDNDRDLYKGIGDTAKAAIREQTQISRILCSPYLFDRASSSYAVKRMKVRQDLSERVKTVQARHMPQFGEPSDQFHQRAWVMCRRSTASSLLPPSSRAAVRGLAPTSARPLPPSVPPRANPRSS